VKRSTRLAQCEDFYRAGFHGKNAVWTALATVVMAIFAMCVAGIAKRQNEINQINQRAWLGPIDWEIFERAESGSGFGRVPSSDGHSFVAFVSSTSHAIAARIS
jgi:heme exporter protein D